MKIALINPGTDLEKALGIFRTAMTPTPPMGIGYLAAVLRKQGHQVVVHDQYASQTTPEETARWVQEEAPALLGFSVLTPNIRMVREIVALLRGQGSQIPVVLGNIHASIYHRELVADRTADYVIHGEGEERILELVEVVAQGRDPASVLGLTFRKNDEVIFTGPRPPISDLDLLPYPAWDLFDLPLYRAQPMLSFTAVTLPIQSARGCPYHCYFCSQNYMAGKVRQRDISKVVDEIEYFHQHLKMNYFGFIDAIFPLSKSRGLAFCEELTRRGLHRLTWVTESKPDLVDGELLRVMKGAGLRLIMYGFEVGDQKILDSMNKQFTLDDARRAMKETKAAGLLSLGLFMMGLPGENRRSIEATLNLAIELDCDIVKFNRAVPYPGSPFFDDYRRTRGEIPDP